MNCASMNNQIVRSEPICYRTKNSYAGGIWPHYLIISKKYVPASFHKLLTDVVIPVGRRWNKGPLQLYFFPLLRAVGKPRDLVEHCGVFEAFLQQHKGQVDQWGGVPSVSLENKSIGHREARGWWELAEGRDDAQTEPEFGCITLEAFHDTTVFQTLQNDEI